MYSPFATPRATREVLEQHGLFTKKSLGQHFLVDDGVVGRILELAKLDEKETVLEVGPGIGTLTAALLDAAGAVIVLERDADLAPVLAQTCAFAQERLFVREGDALTLSWDEVEQTCLEHAWEIPCTLVANLPYAVAATIVLDFFNRFEALEHATVMVQSEVANRISAHSGTKAYGAYTVKLGLCARVTGRFEVAAGCFFPPPRVSSAVIKLERTVPTLNGVPASPELIKAAQSMADAAFAQRRKTLRNSLRSYFVPRGYTRDDADAFIDAAGISPTVRGETLNQEDFLRLGLQLLK